MHKTRHQTWDCAAACRATSMCTGVLRGNAQSPDLGCVQIAQTAQPQHLQPFVAKRLVALVLTERFAILQGDEGDGACDSYALGRVCDSAAVDHEPFSDAMTVLSKTMDYKAGHDAGFAAVCAPSSPFLPAPVHPILANVTDRLH